MKAIYLLLIVSLFTVSAYGQYTDVPHNEDPALPNKRLVANHITTETAYAYRFGKNGISDSALLWTKHYTYNAQNLLIKEETTNSGSKAILSIIYIYDKYNLVFKKAEITVKRSKGKPDTTFFEFRYDTLGNIRAIFKYNSDTSNLTTIQKIYNSRNQLISVLLKIGDDGEFFTIRNLTYNENGDLAAVEYIGNDGNIANERVFSYDYPNRKRLVYLVVKGKRKLYEAYTYNINKDRSRFEQFNSVDENKAEDATPEQITKYYYDERGLLSSETTYVGGGLTSFVKHFYLK